MPTKEEAKQELAKLIGEFNANPRKEHLSEEETREFITEMFKILGWNFKTVEVTQEEKISKGYVDYGFRLNNVPVMFVEAKKTSVDIQDEKWVQQATDYAWHKATTWAVLTNFKRIRIFNSYIRESIRASQLRDIEIHEYLDQFDSIWLLSKESFETRLIDQTAEREGKKAKEKPVEKVLFEDINNWRQELAKDIKKSYGEKYTTEEIDEMVQTLLNRFILVRKIEDEQLEGKKLEEIFNTWCDAKNKKSLWMFLREIFTTNENSFDQDYDSSIFEFSEVDKLEISDYPLKIILQGLYESEDKTIRYNFAFIDADILGNIYEQYLGYLLKTTAKRAKGEESKAKRKEQGIYYTPCYIVDYIVKNTLGEKLKECKSWEDVEKIKVLDPACGSGSFLIRAFDEIHGWYKEKGLDLNMLTAGEGGFETVKDKILKKNIYGVDLDQKAVDIAQLNLLLKTADKKHRLPQLRENIKCGNSLIDDEKVAGDRAFKWEKEFKTIMDGGGFDVVIGNPPWGAELEKSNKQYLGEIYPEVADYESSQYFIFRTLKLLKDGGIFGIIIPNTFALNIFAQKGRNKILEKSSIITIADLSEQDIFEDAKVRSVILFLKKGEYLKEKCHIFTSGKNNTFREQRIVTNEQLRESETWKEFFTSETPKIKLIDRLLKENPKLSDFCEVRQGYIPYRATTLTKRYGASKAKEILENRAWHSKTKNGKDYLKELQGGDVSRYKTNWSGIWVKYGKWVSTYLPLEVFSGERILIREITNGLPHPLFCAYGEDVYVHNPSVLVVLPKIKNIPIKFILGILNSKLIGTVFLHIAPKSKKGLFPKIIITDAKRLPFPKINISEKDWKKEIEETVRLVEKMLSLNKCLVELGDKHTAERQRLEVEIAHTDAEIDDLVYKLYGITDEERKTIEESLK